MSARQCSPKLSRRGIPARVLAAIDTHHASAMLRLGVTGFYRQHQGEEVFEGVMQARSGKAARVLRFITRQLVLPLQGGAES